MDNAPHINALRLQQVDADRAPTVPQPGDPCRLLSLLSVLHGQALQTVFTAIALIESVLDQIERSEAMLPAGRDEPRLRQHRTRLSAELAVARTTAARLSRNLEWMKHMCASFAPHLHHRRLATPANLARLIQRDVAALLR